MDDIDRATEIEQARVQESLGRLAKEMGTKSTGICCDCGDDIEKERLEVAPFARRCISCQKETEKFTRVRRL